MGAGLTSYGCTGTSCFSLVKWMHIKQERFPKTECAERAWMHLQNAVQGMAGRVFNSALVGSLEGYFSTLARKNSKWKRLNWISKTVWDKKKSLCPFLPPFLPPSLSPFLFSLSHLTYNEFHIFYLDMANVCSEYLGSGHHASPSTPSPSFKRHREKQSCVCCF